MIRVGDSRHARDMDQHRSSSLIRDVVADAAGVLNCGSLHVTDLTLSTDYDGRTIAWVRAYKTEEHSLPVCPVDCSCYLHRNVWEPD